jgi:hypothetical protein
MGHVTIQKKNPRRVFTCRVYGKLRGNPGEVDAKAENLTDLKAEHSSLEAFRPSVRSNNTETTYFEDSWSNSR